MNSAARQRPRNQLNLPLDHFYDLTTSSSPSSDDNCDGSKDWLSATVMTTTQNPLLHTCPHTHTGTQAHSMTSFNDDDNDNPTLDGNGIQPRTSGATTNATPTPPLSTSLPGNVPHNPFLLSGFFRHSLTERAVISNYTINIVTHAGIPPAPDLPGALIDYHQLPSAVAITFPPTEWTYKHKHTEPATHLHSFTATLFPHATPPAAKCQSNSLSAIEIDFPTQLPSSFLIGTSLLHV